MRSAAAARRYARALFALATEEGRVAEIADEIHAMGDLVDSNPELREALVTPLHPVRERKAVVGAVAERAGQSQTVRHFYSYLMDQRRVLDFDTIRVEYDRLAAEASGRITATVTSASPLDDSHQARLREVLSRRTGLEVDLDLEVDPALIGGAIAKVGDMVFDGSLRTQLTQLHANLTKGS